MKKFLYLLPVLSLLAVACNKPQPIHNSPAPSTAIPQAQQEQIQPTPPLRNNYVNEAFGFELTFNDKWQGYQAGGVYGSVYTSVPFSVITKDGKSTDVFAILVYPKIEWQKVNRSANGIIFISQNDTNVFAYQLATGTPSEVNSLRNDVPNIFKTFKLPRGITVTSPKPNEVVMLPITVKGYTSGGDWASFEGQTGSVYVTDANGKVISSTYLLRATTDPYKFPTYFEVIIGDRQRMSYLDTNDGFLVFKSSAAKDGEIVKEFELPIKFK